MQIFHLITLYHIETWSLNKTFDDLDHLLKCKNKVFGITADSETRITKQTSVTGNINLKNYIIESTPTEFSA